MRFCTHCGKQILDDAQQFCDACGKPIEESTPELNPTPTGANTSTNEALNDVMKKSANVVNEVIEKVKVLDKKVLLGGAGAAVVVIILIALLLGGSGSYMDPLNDYLKLANKQTTEYMEYEWALMPDFRANASKKAVKAMMEIDDMQESFEEDNESFEDYYDEINDEYDKWNIRFEVKSKEKLDKDDIEDLNDRLEDDIERAEEDVEWVEEVLEDDDMIEMYAEALNSDEEDMITYLKATKIVSETYVDNKITAAYEVKGKFIIEADKDEFETNTVKLIFVKIDGDWSFAGADEYISIEDSEGHFDFIIRELNRYNL